MPTLDKSPEQREVLPADIDRLILLLNTLREELLNCEEDKNFDLDYWYARILLPANLCADIVRGSNGLLRELFDPWAEYPRNFSGTEHILNFKPTSKEAFLGIVGHFRCLLIPLALLFLYAAKNPGNQTANQDLVTSVTRLVASAIRVRGEDNETRKWNAMDTAATYFKQNLNS